jgi:succinate dehydrogenase / fumarate reductase cytochrome b subunit
MIDTSTDQVTQSDSTKSTKPSFRNLNFFKDLWHYRLPITGWVSILHRISGVLLFLLAPFILWLFDLSLTSEISFRKFKMLWMRGSFHLPPGFWKSALLVLIALYTYHALAGLRFLVLDVCHRATNKKPARVSAAIVLVLSLALTLAFGLKLFGWY